MYRKFHSVFLVLPLLFTSAVFAGSVSRAQFSSAIVDREPVDQVERLDIDDSQIWYFSELRDLQGQSITHQWTYDDQVVFEKTFNIGGPRWRVWSSKNLQPGWIGTWTVHTLDADGNKLLSQDFQYR